MASCNRLLLVWACSLFLMLVTAGRRLSTSTTFIVRRLRLRLGQIPIDVDEISDDWIAGTTQKFGSVDDIVRLFSAAHEY